MTIEQVGPGNVSSSYGARSTVQPRQIASAGVLKPDYDEYVTQAERSALQALVSGDRNREYPIEQYGTVTQARYFAAAGSMSIGSPVLTVNGYTFTSNDIGKTVGIKGPGVGSATADFDLVANDGVLVATIVSVASGLATLSVAATQTASACPCIIGFPIDDAILAAVTQCRADYAEDGVGGVVLLPGGCYLASTSLPVSSGVTIAGQNRDSTRVYVVKITADANEDVASAWIRRASDAPAVMQGINITKFSLIGTFFASSSIYGTDMKMIHISGTNDSFVTWMRIVDNPSTALGYDGSNNCVLAHNIIVSPGRLARIYTFTGTSAQTGGAGGSGIGVTVGSTLRSMHIHDNHIIGTLASGMGQFSAGAVGRSGINIEAASSTPAHPTYAANGIVIENNTITGFYNGIVDSGGWCTHIVNNNVRSCVHGIKSGSNGIAYGRPARDTIVIGNDVRNGFVWNTTYIPFGIVVWGRLGSTADDNANNLKTHGRTLISNNVVTNIANGYGIGLIAFAGAPSDGPIGGVSIENNLVSDCGLSGIRMASLLSNISIRNNRLVSNGKDGTAGNKAPLLCDTGTTWDGGWLSGNSYWDIETSPTQDSAPTFNNAVLTGVYQSPGVLMLPAGTAANLPAASATYKGVRATVTDGTLAYTTANVGTTVTGGGANTVPVFCNGTNWIIG